MDYQPLVKKSLGVCGLCQLDKQLKSTHKAITHVPTSKVPELLYMDLMGPMQVSIAGGKN